MATIKHLTSKNSNYAAAESYLTFQHNEYTGLPILDEKGRPKLRDSYLLDTLECGESSFAMACLIANRKYGKNGGREDVKTHHYIVSFDPKDAVENGLTMEKAQALGLQFCKDNFPGHPAIVCTHPDGHNSAGNIHLRVCTWLFKIENDSVLWYIYIVLLLMSNKVRNKNERSLKHKIS